MFEPPFPIIAPAFYTAIKSCVTTNCYVDRVFSILDEHEKHQ